MNRICIVMIILTAAPALAWADSRSSVKRKCRKPGSSYSARTAHLPVCRSASETSREASYEELDSQDRRKRQDDVNFDAYMNQNAGHPALTRQSAGHQQAFKDPVRRTISSDPPPASSATAGAPAASVDVPDSNGPAAGAGQ